MTPNMANRVAERLAMSGRSDGIPQTQCLNLRFSEFRAVVGMVRAVLRPIRGYVRNIDSTRYIADPANGDRCLVLGWSGDIAQARRRASEAGKTVTIGCSVDGPNADGQTNHSRRDRIKGTRPPEIFR